MKDKETNKIYLELYYKLNSNLQEVNKLLENEGI